MVSCSLAHIPKITCCCCGCSLRVGSLIISWIGLVSSVLLSVFLVIHMHSSSFPMDSSSHLGLKKINLLLGGLALLCTIKTVIYLLLLIGVHKKNISYMKPGIILHCFIEFLLVVFIVISFFGAFYYVACLAPCLLAVLFSGINLHWLQVLSSYFTSNSRPHVYVV